jgi:hypothetical protein
MTDFRTRRSTPRSISATRPDRAALELLLARVRYDGAAGCPAGLREGLETAGVTMRDLKPRLRAKSVSMAYHKTCGIRVPAIPQVRNKRG